MWKKIKPYVFSILIAFAVGGLSALLTRNSMNLYDEVKKPFLAPPGIVFPIVWTILFALMGFSAARIWILRKKAPEEARQGLWWYGFNLFLNFGWTLIFFRLRTFLIALIWLVILGLVIFAMIRSFRRIDKLAGNLQIPYLIWVAFACYLNAATWLLNR